MNQEVIVERLLIFIPLVLSLSVHEWAHAWSAWRLGDDTAKLQGRLSLNPLVHIDPIGTVLLPLMGVPFGWAKPVPVQPTRFRQVSPRTGMMIVAVAGPISNIVLAVLSVGALVVFYLVDPERTKAAVLTEYFLQYFVILNVLLASFNMIPIPPLDGSRVADALMPNRLRPLWNQFYQLGPFLLIALLVVPILLNVGLFDGLLGWTYRLLIRLRTVLS